MLNRTIFAALMDYDSRIKEKHQGYRLIAFNANYAAWIFSELITKYPWISFAIVIFFQVKWVELKNCCNLVQYLYAKVSFDRIFFNFLLQSKACKTLIFYLDKVLYLHTAPYRNGLNGPVIRIKTSTFDPMNSMKLKWIGRNFCWRKFLSTPRSEMSQHFPVISLFLPFNIFNTVVINAIGYRYLCYELF